jgi:hypothetical protein
VRCRIYRAWAKVTPTSVLPYLGMNIYATPYDARVFIQATRVKAYSQVSGDTYDSREHGVLCGGCLLMWLYSGSMIIPSLDILPYSRRILSIRKYLPNKRWFETILSTPYTVQTREYVCTCVPPLLTRVYPVH